MNCGPPDHLAPCFLDLNWGLPMGPAAAPESLAVSELVGRLGSISNPTGEMTPHSQYMGTPLSSPPKLHLSMMDHHQQQQLSRGDLAVAQMPVPHLAPLSADPEFVERAARLSSFGGVGRNYGGLVGQFGFSVAGKPSMAASGQSLRANGPQLEMGSAEFGNAREESSMSGPVSASESNARKRKAAPKGKGKDPAIFPTSNDPKTAEGEDGNAKRCRSTESSKTEKDEVKPKIDQNGSTSSTGDERKKQPEPPKDYIHVRARRGQATDSHSLAERVRREKISERMKLLQDLVPGCNKVTGKALMLDEIINYVQSLQRQVEFLSMKLASVNPRLDFNVESILSKDVHQTSGPLLNSVYPLETSAAAFSFGHQPQQGTPLPCVVTNGESQCLLNPLEPALHRTLGMQLHSIDGFGDATSQLGTFWDDDLQHVVQMSLGQGQEMAFSSHGFHDPVHAAHMKIEL